VNGQTLSLSVAPVSAKGGTITEFPPPRALAGLISSGRAGWQPLVRRGQWQPDRADHSRWQHHRVRSPHKSSDPFSITAGPNGNLWFTEENAGKIGRVTTK
jgi:hypothetical protein